MRIGVDVSGGDNAPHEILKGSFDALSRIGEEDSLVLAGDPEVISEAMAERGIEDPDPLIATYRDLIEKWHGLTGPLQPIRDNPQPYADLLRQEIYSKIDLTTYPN